MNKEFDKHGFIIWLKETFIDVGRDENWTWNLVENIIDYGVEHKNASRDQLAEFLTSVIPEVTLLEVTRFCDDNILTERLMRLVGR